MACIIWHNLCDFCSVQNRHVSNFPCSGRIVYLGLVVKYASPLTAPTVTGIVDGSSYIPPRDVCPPNFLGNTELILLQRRSLASCLHFTVNWGNQQVNFRLCDWLSLWCRRLSTRYLYVGPLFGRYILNELVCKFNKNENDFLSCILIYWQYSLIYILHIFHQCEASNYHCACRLYQWLHTSNKTTVVDVLLTVTVNRESVGFFLRPRAHFTDDFSISIHTRCKFRYDIVACVKHFSVLVASNWITTMRLFHGIWK